jgi:predicted protein tyrosine phosphatase
VIHACKEPYHRKLLRYTGRGAPKNHPEYYFAHRQNRLFCNLVDADDKRYIPEVIIDEALRFVNQELSKGRKVLVHCNKGYSRSACIGMLYLKQKGMLSGDFKSAEMEYLELYPNYNPGNGMRQYTIDNWNRNIL